MEEFGPPSFPKPTEARFAVLVRSITQQQLAGPAARAIHGRLVSALDGEVTPERMLSVPEETLREAGLSGRKAASLRDLAGKIMDGTLRLDGRALSRESDEEIVARLSSVRGIGKWSAEIFLMFQLRRLDVWPTGDLGVRKGYALAWGGDVLTPKQLEQAGDVFRPYRSIAAWYCWTALRSGSGNGPEVS
ncbi:MULTISPECIES: DNA-3-methyladenine glycosylase family protein [unclassified Streptomyces]|uniref:DNA-3-methyladenine glycosylase family protein n=1 Tax=unclassified Streptomyces TaxID=2593676 RepID=UPI0013709122|nr:MULTISPECIES: DNA-3-methyladenine glycosylase 2 family protein [unclassified Streptomyces]MYS24149.1 DNA-3-methyladenine glycosylase 2 family protein [Streptomyces sp. SID4948]